VNNTNIHPISYRFILWQIVGQIFAVDNEDKGLPLVKALIRGEPLK